MRLLVAVLTLLFFLSLLMFLMTNLGARVDIVIWDQTYADVPVYLLVILSAFAGCLVVGIIAVAEGANIRLSNRRLRREIHQLETQINYLRTQPPAGSRSSQEPVAGGTGGRADSSRQGGTGDDRQGPPSAPVYGAEGAAGDDPDDDIYSGGRAV